MNGRAGFCLALLLAGVARADTPRPFDAGTPAALRTHYAGRPYILAFWSLECGYCQAELQTFARWRKRRPDLPLVLVATDAPGHTDAIARRLAELGLADADSRLFADAMPERIHFAVDRKWRGDLPRTYLYDAAHRTTTVSGALDEPTLAAWIAAHLDERERAAARGKGTP